MAANKEACRIGSTITISGNISGDQELIVEGRIEGRIGLESRLIVEEVGNVEAQVEATEVEIKGVVKGDIAAGKVATLQGTARVLGNVRASKVVVIEGAQVSGAIEMDVDLPPELSGAANAKA